MIIIGWLKKLYRLWATRPSAQSIDFLLYFVKAGEVGSLYGPMTMTEAGAAQIREAAAAIRRAHPEQALAVYCVGYDAPRQEKTAEILATELRVTVRRLPTGELGLLKDGLYRERPREFGPIELAGRLRRLAEEEGITIVVLSAGLPMIEGFFPDIRDIKEGSVHLFRCTSRRRGSNLTDLRYDD